MIRGIGTDIVDLNRIEKVLFEFPNFPNRILTKKEMMLYKNNKQISFLAGRFCAKEAISKALGSGIGKLSWQMIEILPDQYGKPIATIIMHKDIAFEGKIHLSISHEKSYATAVAIWEVSDDKCFKE